MSMFQTTSSSYQNPYTNDRNKMTSSILPSTIALALIFSATITNFICASHDFDSAKAPRDSYDIGPFKLESFYNEANSKEKLRTSKSYLKVTMADKSSPGNQFATMKVSRLEELVRCQNLTLESGDLASEILDCRPIEAYLDADDYPRLLSDYSGGSGGDYIRRSSIRLKEKFQLPLKNVFQQYHFYPLDRNLIDRTIEGLVDEHNLTSLDFTDLRINLGYYFEVNLGERRDEVDPVVCTGKIFLSVNRTEILARYSNDPYPEFIDEAHHFFNQGLKNGYLLKVQDFNCTKTGDSMITKIVKSMTGNFTMIQRLKFPYLVLRHTMKSEPILAVLDYAAQVDQMLDPEVGPLAYNTTVQITSRSGWFDSMSFDLRQVFANQDPITGMEDMKLTHSEYGAFMVDALWNSESFAKVFRWCALDFTLNDKGHKDNLKLVESIKVSYLSVEKDNHDIVQLKIKKKFLDSLMPSLLDKFVDSLARDLIGTEEQSTMLGGGFRAEL